MNFDSNERFKLKTVNGKPNTLRFEYQISENMSEDFFSLRKRGRKGQVESISAVVGANGSGKTSVASALYNLGVKREEDHRNSYVVAVYKSKNKYVCVHGGHWLLDIDGLPDKVRLSWREYKIENLKDLPFRFVYYSPFVTTEQVLESVGDNFIDISTGNILREIEENESRGERSVFEYYSDVDHLKFMRLIRAKDDLKINLPEGFEFRLPVDVDVFADSSEFIFDDGNRQRNGPLLYMDAAYLLSQCWYLPYRVFGYFVHQLMDSFPINDVPLAHSIVTLGKACKKLYDLQQPSQLSDEDCQKGFDIIKESVAGANFSAWSKINKESLEEFFSTLREYYERYASDRKIALQGAIKNDIITFSSFEEQEFSMLTKLILAHSKIGCRHNLIQIKYAKMSSGEMAYMTLFARLFAIFSSQNSTQSKNAVRDMLIFLDEAETTLHPAWQRTLVLYLIWFVENFAKGWRVQLVFATHSPLLLSDVPNNNVVYLHEDTDRKPITATEFSDEVKTFGANIFDLYAEKFTLKEGTIGAFATLQINKALKEVGDVVSRRQEAPLSKDSARILNLVGERAIIQYIQDLKESGLICT